jgi:cobalt-zinc-cadmium efflux system membrane fusion protein
VPVLSLAGGRVLDVRARLGDDVTKGQVLLLISSPEVSQAFSDYQKAQADEVLASRELQRSQDLYSRGAIAQKDLQAAEDAAQKASVDVKTAAEHIRILGAQLDRPSPVIEVRAPISGTITEQNVSGGTGVKSLDNSPNLFTIADLSRVWVLCDVYENNLAQVHAGDHATVRLNAFPGRVFDARVSNISRVLDPTTRSAKVRLELDNPDGLLRPNLFATATFVSAARQARLTVPASAVLKLQDRMWVFRKEGNSRFRRVEIQTGVTLPDGSEEVLAGLNGNDAIVANALQFSSAVEAQSR